MKKFLFPLFFGLIITGSLGLVSTHFVTTVEAQLLTCPSLARSPSPCLNADGSTRPPNTYGDCPAVGGANETCYDRLNQRVRFAPPPDTDPQDPANTDPQDPGETDPIAEANKRKICEDIIAEVGSIQAEERSSIVPCGRAVHQCEGATPGNEQCEFRHLFILVNNIVSRFITVVFAPLLVIVLTYIGFLFIKDKAGAKTKAKELLMKVLIGTFFVLAAWLIVNFILNALGAEDGLTKFIN